MIHILLFCLNAFASSVQLVEVNGTINPGSAAFVVESLQKAESENAELFIVRLNTPGGLISSARQIIQGFAESKVPVVVWVHPGGSSATSAGALIALSAHLVAMASGTNMGAAHPVDMNGQDIKGVMGEKITNDVSALARAQALLHGRKADLAEQIVTKSRSFSSKEALDAGLADFIADDIGTLLNQVGQRKLKVSNKEVMPKVAASSEVTHRAMGLKQFFLNFLSDPNVSAMLMTLGGLALWAEVSSGFSSVAAGVIGVLAFLLALVSLQTLPVNTGGALLMILGFIFLVMEAFITSYGLLTLAAMASLFVGGLFLIDPTGGTMRVSLSLLISLVAGVAVIVLAIGAMILRDRHKILRTGMAGQLARVTTLNPGSNSGSAEVNGEIWNFSTSQAVAVGDELEVTAVNGMKLILERKK